MAPEVIGNSQNSFPVPLPDDWECSIAEEVCSKITKGTTPPQSQLSSAGNIPFIRVNNLTVGGAHSLNGAVIFVTRQAHGGFLARSIALPGDILMNIVGPPLGKVTKLDDQFEEYNLNQAVLIYRIIKEKIESEFFFNYLNSSMAQQWLDTRAKKTSGQKNLTIALCKELPVPLPPTSEQRKIAEVLSTWNQATEVVTSLIANSRAKKKALIQTLLENPAWPLIKLGEAGEISSAGVDKKSEEGQEATRLLNYTDAFKRDFIHDGDLDHWVTAPDRQIEKCDVRKGDVFFTPSSETRDDIAHSAVAAEDIPGAVYSYHVVRLRLHEPWDLNFRAFAFKSAAFYRQAYALCEGSGQRYVLSQRYFREMCVRVPPVEEQRRIGAVLKAVHDEYSKLYNIAEFLRSEKRALIQQLLTGKRRVKVTEVSHD